MRKRQLLKTLTTGGLFAALLVLGMSMVPSSGRAANDNNGSQDEKQMIRIGLSVASSSGIQLNLAGKDQDMVGLGSYLVNVAGDCNGCHSQGPATEWCCAVAGIPPNSGTGNPYLLSPPFSGTKQVNPKTYLGGGRDFGALPGQTVHIVSRNLTPNLNGVPEGDRSLSDFKQILRTGVDLDQLHPNCPTNAPNCLTPPFNGAVLQIMPWPTLQDMTDRQLTAIYTFLSAIPCIDTVVAGQPQLRNVCQ
jgi:hypothetical protein